MEKANRNALILFPILVLIGFLAGLAGSQGSSRFFGMPLFGLLIGLVFVIQWLVFIPSYLLQTEKLFDLTGSATYIIITILAVLLSPNIDARSILIAGMVVIWAARLGGFLFARIQKAGKDDRFDEIKPHFFRFLNVWTIQALWITFTAAAALVAITTTNRKDLDLFSILGLVLWVTGFGIEVLADTQKWRFNANPANRGRFIKSGLWSRSRHPNYFGEILLWIGVAVIALPVLRGWQWAALISPIFVTLLLTRVSGIPLLEDKADKKWGGQEDYETYKANTPVLIPKL